MKIFSNILGKTHKWEALRVTGARLDEEFIPPTVQSFEALWIVNIVNQNTAVGSTVKCNP
jgi:hypothetical protein